MDKSTAYRVLGVSEKISLDELSRRFGMFSKRYKLFQMGESLDENADELYLINRAYICLLYDTGTSGTSGTTSVPPRFPRLRRFIDSFKVQLFILAVILATALITMGIASYNPPGMVIGVVTSCNFGNRIVLLSVSRMLPFWLFVV